MPSIQYLLSQGDDYDDQNKRHAAQQQSERPLRRKAHGIRKTIAYNESKLAGHGHVPASRWGSYMLAFLVFALALFLGDVAVIGWMAQITAPETPAAIRIFWATIAGFCLSAVFHVGFHLLVQDRDRTERTVRRHLWFGLPALGAGLACFGLLRIYPFLPSAAVAVLNQVTWAIPIVLCTALPLGAGAFSSLVHYFGLPKLYRRRLQRAEEQLELLLDRQALIRSTSSTKGPAPAPPGLGSQAARERPRTKGLGSNNPLKVLPLIGTLMLLPLVTRCTSGPEAAILAEPTVVSAAQGERPKRERVACDLSADATATVSPDGRRQGTRTVVQHLPAWLALHGCTELMVGTFGNDGAWGRGLQRFAVPQPRQADCRLRSRAAAGESVEGPPKTFQELLNRDLRPDPQTSLDDVSDEACELTAEELETYARALDQLQRDVYRALTVSDEEVVTAGVTNLVGVIASQNFGATRAALILTDGLDNASPEVPRFSLRADYHPEFVIVPTAEDHSWATSARVQERLADFQAAIPGLTIRYFDSISEETWRAGP